MSTKPPRHRRVVKPTELPRQYSAGFLAGVDRRHKAALLASHHFAELLASLGGDDATPQQKMVAERACWAHVRLQQLEAEFCAGAGLDAQEWATLVNVQLSALRLLGLARRARRVPSLGELLSGPPVPAAEAIGAADRSPPAAPGDVVAAAGDGGAGSDEPC